MAYLFVALGVFFFWNLLLTLYDVEMWVPWFGAIGLGIGGAVLIEPEEWWFGFGLAGAGYLILMVSDLLLVATDAMKAKLLRKM